MPGVLSHRMLYSALICTFPRDIPLPPAFVHSFHWVALGSSPDFAQNPAADKDTEKKDSQRAHGTSLVGYNVYL